VWFSLQHLSGVLIKAARNRPDAAQSRPDAARVGRDLNPSMTVPIPSAAACHYRWMVAGVKFKNPPKILCLMA